MKQALQLTIAGFAAVAVGVVPEIRLVQLNTSVLAATAVFAQEVNKTAAAGYLGLVNVQISKGSFVFTVSIHATTYTVTAVQPAVQMEVQAALLDDTTDAPATSTTPTPEESTDTTVPLIIAISIVALVVVGCTVVYILPCCRENLAQCRTCNRPNETEPDGGYGYEYGLQSIRSGSSQGGKGGDHDAAGAGTSLERCVCLNN